ncbi:Fic family protein [Paenibacillus septentrionalis]|uniref:Fic family protein n=1 Tax=Paenibacillus septentrionalis TaxID=429342 RepID=A0ABW1V2I7_9BACL
MNWYKNEASTLHPIVRAAMLHAIFVGIHPFIDGNGRTSRLLLNLELMKDGYPPIIIEVKHRLAYYESLDEAIAKKNYTDFIDLVALATENSLDLYLSVLD